MRKLKTSTRRRVVVGDAGLALRNQPERCRESPSGPHNSVLTENFARMKITEGIESTWHYHLSADYSPHKSLCGRSVMCTEMRLEQWGKTPPNYHIPERWCTECERLAAIGAGSSQDKEKP